MAVVHSQPLPLPPWLPQDLKSSKWLWDEVTAGLKCGDILHAHEESCAAALSATFSDMLVGATKFYVPYYMMYFIWNGKKTLSGDLAFFKNMGYFYARSMAYAVANGALFTASQCAVARITGISYWTNIIAATIGGLGIFLEHSFRRRIVINTFTNIALNYLYRRAQLSELIPQRSDIWETAFFMAVNSLLLHLLHKAQADDKKTPVFWFYTPDAVRDQPAHVEANGQLKCPVPHIGSCLESTLKQTAKFSALAVALQSLRLTLLSRGGMSPANFFRNFFTRRTIASISSIGGYVFLYKSLRCVLGKRYQCDRSEHSALAGLAAGSAYWLMPNTTILSSAVIAATTLLLDQLPGRLKFASQWPMPELLYMLCSGLLFSARMQDAAACPRHFITMLDLSSSNRSRNIYNAYIQNLSKFETKILG